MQTAAMATLATVMPAISAVDKPLVSEGGLLPLLVVGDGPFPGVGPLPGVVVIVDVAIAVGAVAVAVLGTGAPTIRNPFDAQ